MVKTTQASKSWRSTVSDAFADNRFFNATPASNAQWQPLISALMTTDKERLPDLIGKAPSSAFRIQCSLSSRVNRQSFNRFLGKHLHEPRARKSFKSAQSETPHLHALHLRTGSIPHTIAYHSREACRPLAFECGRYGSCRGKFSVPPLLHWLTRCCLVGLPLPSSSLLSYRESASRWSLACNPHRTCERSSLEILERELAFLQFFFAIAPTVRVTR